MTKLCYVPVLSTIAGSCLTAQNWHEVGAQIGAYYLELLLQKPGADYLTLHPGLAKYLGWQHSLVVNASTLIINSKGEFVVKSIYDGSKTTYNVDFLIDFICALQPQIAILPHGFYSYSGRIDLPKSIQWFFPYTDYPLSNTDFGISCSAQDLKTLNVGDYPLYIHSLENHLSLDLLPTQHNLIYCESDKPALDAYNGIIYTKSNEYNLLDETCSKQFINLDPECECPVCDQNFTRAYLQHLFKHVPLLCYRYLIQHNYFSRCSA